MPPKAKYSKEEIIAAALDIVRQEGFAALTARALGARLGCSSQPIFTVFKNMEDVQFAVMEAAREVYRAYVRRGLDSELPFKAVGTQYILFAAQEPRLFKLLFMTEQKETPGIDGILPLIDDSYGQILRSIQRTYGLSRSAAQRLYQHLWIYTHGIATLFATGMCRFTGDEISSMMTEVCMSLLKKLRGEET